MYGVVKEHWDPGFEFHFEFPESWSLKQQQTYKKTVISLYNSSVTKMLDELCNIDPAVRVSLPC